MSVVIEIRVAPQSSKQAVVLDKAGKIKVFLHSPPEKGKANQELILFLAERLHIARSAITIIGGHAFRTKRIAIEGFDSIEQVMKILDLVRDQQLTIG